jgi:very-short-patch-repair endonuclease
METGAERGKPRPHDSESRPDAFSPVEQGKPRPREKSAHAGNEIPGVEVARLASGQKGAITRRQLRDAGLRSGAIDWRAGNGQLHRQFRGVYLVGHEALAPLAREAAALLACGDGAMLSHESAALAWGIVEDYAGDVHVTVVGRKRRSRPGLRIHRTSSAPPTRPRHGLLVTSPAQTLLDLAASGSPHLEDAFTEAHGARLVRATEIQRTLERVGPRSGTRALRALVVANESGFTRSKAERKLRALLRAARLPEPETNATVLGLMVDCLWAEQRLVVEFDSVGFHGHRRAFETDRRRDAILVAHGYRVMRITWSQLTEQPYMVLANVASALATRINGGASPADK